MIAAGIQLLEANVDRVVEFEMLDGTQFLATPLFVYMGEENPDVFVLRVERAADGTLVVARSGRSILLQDIADIRVADSG